MEVLNNDYKNVDSLTQINMTYEATDDSQLN